MDLQIDNDCLACTITGQWVTAELKIFIDTIAEELKRRHCHRVLTDMASVIGPPPDLDRFDIGKYVASALPDIKVAIVYHKVLANTLFEDTAVNRGAEIKVFPDRESALQWILQ